MLCIFLRFILFALVKFQPRPVRERNTGSRHRAGNARQVCVICGKYPTGFK